MCPRKINPNPKTNNDRKTGESPATPTTIASLFRLPKHPIASFVIFIRAIPRDSKSVHGEEYVFGPFGLTSRQYHHQIGTDS